MEPIVESTSRTSAQSREHGCWAIGRCDVVLDTKNFHSHRFMLASVKSTYDEGQRTLSTSTSPVSLRRTDSRSSNVAGPIMRWPQTLVAVEAIESYE